MFIVMPFLALIYLYVWSALVKSSLVVIASSFHWFWIIDGKQPHERTYALACGKLSGTVFEISRAYMFFWPEYEGKSSWEKGFINNKKGCDANLVSLGFELLWPSMEPAYSMEIRPGFISVSLYPGPTREVNAASMIDFIIRQRKVSDDQRDNFDEALGLFYELHATDSSYIAQGRVALYWTDAKAAEQVIIECKFMREDEPYTCDQKWINDGIGSTVSIYYQAYMVSNWKIIKRDIDQFIDVHKK